MGDQLMKQVMRDWGDLPGNAYKVLMVIAACCMDDSAQPRYWGGWKRLAITGLRRGRHSPGCDVDSCGDDSHIWPEDRDESAVANRVREAHRKRVALAVADLISNGAIVSVQPARKQLLRAEYFLTLERLETADKRPEELPETVQFSTEKRPDNSRKPSRQGPTTTQISQPGEQISPVGVRHQGSPAAVDKARSTTGDLERRRRQMDEQGVA